MIRKSVSALIVSLLVAAMAFGVQLTTGTITGSVTDESKAAIPGVSVTVKNIDTGLTRTIISNEQGHFDAPNLPVGTYEVTGTMAGFGTAVRQGIVLVVGRTAVIDMMLPVATLKEQLIVVADAPLIETSTATVSNLIDQKKVQDLPLINRDLTQLTFLQPGVLKIPSSGNQGVFSGMGDKFTVAGARGTQNLYLLDGISNSDLSGNPQGVSGALMGSETIQEIQIVTNNYSAEYRSAAGGIVSAVTKSGTNTFHGSVFEFFRNDSLNAPSYFDKAFGIEKPDFRQNQFGGSLGGPVKPNKLFFFASYEGLRQQSNSTETALVPSSNVQQGKLASGRTVIVDPKIRPFLSLFPIPGQGNRMVQEFGDTVLIAGARKQPVHNDFVTGKLDFQINDRNTISGTYNFDQGERSPISVLGDLISTGSSSRKHLVSGKWTSVFTTSSVNEIGVGFSDSEPTGDIPLNKIDFSKQGLTFRPDRKIMGQINIPGITSIGYRQDFSRYRQRAYSAKESYSLTKGNNSFHLGGEWTYYRYNIGSCSRGCAGTWDFADIPSFLTRIPRRFEVMLPGGDITTRNLGQHLLGVYFQDNWRASKQFSLNLGLRYEFASVPTEADGKISNLIDFFDANVKTGVLYKNPTKKSFSPRVGFVWASDGSQFSVRGGFGIFYEHPMLYNIRTSLQELPPYTLVGRIDQRDAQRIGQEIDFPNAFATQINLARGRPNIRTFQYNLDQTYIYRWSLSLQRQFWTSWVASADYTGSRGLHLWQQSLPNINKWEGWPNQPPPGTKFFPAGSALINPNWGEMRLQYSNANSYYQGGSFGIQHRPTTGPQFGGAFTYSKAIDTGSGITSGGDELPQEQRGIYAWDTYLKRGLSSFDTRKSFTANITYEIHRGAQLNGLAGLIAKGWQLNSVVTLSDGYPLSVLEDSDAQIARIGDDEDLRPDRIPGSSKKLVLGDPNRYFDTSQFTPARIGYFGNAGRNIVTSPGLANVDLSVFKNIDIESGRLQFRIETFNLFNRANFGTPDMTAFINEKPNPTAGRITRTRTPGRQMQLGLRLTF